MKKLALNDEILLQIDKPSRYLGNEFNVVEKDMSLVDIRFAMCFPDVYEIGMSHLGMQILYDMFNEREDIYCERVYSPWVDLHKIMKEKNIPLFSLESQDNIKDFDFLGITIQYEMCYTNILQILDLSQIPMLASNRGESHPIVIGGGPCSYNPEPLADFFDIFYIGEGETTYFELMDLYKKYKTKSRKEFLHKASEIEGIYVPLLSEVEYYDNGLIKKLGQKTVKKQLVENLSDTYYPRKPLVPFLKPTHDRVTLEIQRGCIRGCRFCQAGMIYRPIRERSLEFLKNLARDLLKNTGHEEISLTSLSSSDYTQLEELINFLIDEYREKHVNISLPSLRIDAFSIDVMSKVQDIKKSSLTFAPEAGTQRLRDVINKGLTEEQILNGATLAFKSGWNKVKLYFMLGLPSEETKDMEGIGILADKIAMAYYDTVPKEERNGKVMVSVSTSFFVPKPFTPFQWAPMYAVEDYVEKAKTVKSKIGEMLNKKSIRYNWHHAETTIIEGFLARGDRRIGKVILDAYENGSLYDSWSEFFNYDIWVNACKNQKIDMDFYTLREKMDDEILPWDFIDVGVKKEFLLNEWNKSKEPTVTLNCKELCSGCGASELIGGACIES